MALFAKIATYPPLEQVTIVPPSRDQFNFTVVVESSSSLPETPWEVSIWYDHGTYSGAKPSWKALELTPVDTGPYVLHDSSENERHRYTFTGNLASPYTSPSKTYSGRKVAFTVRYRIDSDAEWQWVYHNFNLKDGELVLQPPIDPNFLGASPVVLKDGWLARKLTSEAPDARLYSMESSSPIPVPKEGNATYEKKVLGRVTQTCRWMALVRIWAPWMAPRHGEKDFHLSEPAVLLSFLRSDGLNVVLLALNGIDDVLTEFRSDDNGDIVVSARNDSGKDRKFRVVSATAWKFELANAAVMYEARRLVRQSAAYREAVDRLPKHIKAESVDSDTILVTDTKSQDDPAANPQWLESWYDSLAYCTWNSLGQDLNAEKIMEGLDSLAKNKIHIATLIIDDNWQSLDGKQGETDQSHRGWKAFEANPDGFPEGLKAAVAKIREKHPAIRDIAVWHALLGYWGCISPEGEIAKNYKTLEVHIVDGTPPGGKRLVVHPDDIHRMYDDFYRFLSSCGVTGVKTDAQFMLDWLADTPDRRAITNTFQSAWTQAHLRHLSAKAISCMSMCPQILYHSFLPTNTPRVMLRNSDDFFPDVPTSHPWHIFVNAHNALFVQHLNVLPDWDMFQTSHPYSGFHAAGRCLSGGPIYITDAPGAHDVDLIHQMTALNPRGQTVILRPSTVGKTMGVYDKYDDKGVLKVGVYDGKAEVGSGILGVFNIAEHEIGFVLPITKFPGVNVIEDEQQEVNGATAAKQHHQQQQQRRWIVRSHQSRKLSRPITPTEPSQPSSLLQATLPIRGYDIWTALPVHSFTLSSSPPSSSAGQRQIDIAVVGLLGKMTGACAIVESRFTVMSGRLRVHVTLKALGVLGIWVSDAATRQVDDLMVMMQGSSKVVPKERVQINTEHADGEGTGVVEIDVEGAWRDLGLGAGWSNEVGIEVYFP